jgi:hypothetical protein
MDLIGLADGEAADSAGQETKRHMRPYQLHTLVLALIWLDLAHIEFDQALVPKVLLELQKALKAIALESIPLKLAAPRRRKLTPFGLGPALDNSTPVQRAA